MFTLADKADEPGLIEAARIIGATLMALPIAALNAQAERILTPSAPAQARFGVANIAEAAALAGAGQGARLLGPRLAADGATCAVALSPERPTLFKNNDDRALHRRRPGRSRSHHNARARSHRALTRVPFCRLAGPARVARSLPGRRADRRHRAARSRHDRHALCRGDRERQRRGAPPFGRPFDLERHGRAIAAPQAGRGAVHGHARGAGVCRCRRSARARADSAGRRAVPGADADFRSSLADARARDA